MSAYIKQETCINDEALLLEALKEKGYSKVEVHTTPQPLVAYQGDYRTADGEGHTRNPALAMKAHVIIRRKDIGGASNDIGFIKNEKGNYEAVISNYDSHKHNAKWMEELKQDYGVRKAKKIAKKHGMQLLKNTTTTDGKIRLTLKVNV